MPEECSQQIWHCLAEVALTSADACLCSKLTQLQGSEERQKTHLTR
ncbi:hypothetical protein PPIS_b1026 [Pseudoalteromonas piscicida]|uniref:Uncharacterized protein n=1 Tax=Pseudoalteromonas piscicida TaxID=43662 RepID=A0ABM6NN71_PSEO7|nr:hypothetical protein PPIS_b1026 [Pseudoalteromonas piscicida]